MKSIKAKLMVSISILICFTCMVLGAISFIMSSNALKSNLGKTLPKIAEQTASNIQGLIEGDLNVLEAIAARDDIKDPNIPWDKKVPILLSENKRINGAKLIFADKDGNSINSDGLQSSCAEKDYFKKAMSGQSNVTDPIVSKTDGSIVVIYAVPIKYNNEIIGALLEKQDGNRLSDLTNQVKIGRTGTAFMVNGVGTTIANQNKDLVLQMSNIIEEAKKDADLQSFADVESKMLTKETGIGEYKYNGADKYVGYAPVQGTDWSVGIAVEETEILSELDSLKLSTVLSAILFILIGFITVFIISNNISKGIKSTSKHLKSLAQGNLCEKVSAKYLSSKDEVGTMTNSMKSMQESLREMIGKIKENSLSISEQSENLSSVSEEIANVSQNVTGAISGVAQGASNQSEELIHISEILDEFSNKLSRMVTEIQVVDKNSREISLMAGGSSSEMNELNRSVSNASNLLKEFYRKIMTLGNDITQINEITALINSIAEETNLLALNAAIEAARAGEAGRGFSIVADEIRKLAEQSKDSSENISKLINAIAKNTEVIVKESATIDNEMMNQTSIIDNSMTSFRKIIQAVDEVIPKIETVRNSAENIEKDKNEILIRIEGVSSVSVEVSASSEEISSSSEEMNAATEEVASAALILNDMTNQMLEEINNFRV